MEDYNSKYTGEEIEQLLDKVENLEETQQLSEQDISNMGFTKNQGTITEVKMNGESKGTSGIVNLGTVITEHQDISGKVDKVDGKQLSTEDFTTTLKSKLESLSNYDDTQIENAVSSLQTQLNTLVGDNASNAIESFNEIIAFLDGIADSEDLNSIIASIEQQIATKANADSLAKVATSGSYNDLKNQPTIPSAVTESTVSGWGFTKNAGTYSKPSTGIPFSDFEEQVQGSIIKAEESVQSVSMSVTTGNATAGNFFNVNKDANGNVSIQMIQNTLASGKIAIPYTTDVKQYIDQAVANAGGGGGSTSGIQWTTDVLVESSGTIQLEPFVVYYGGEFSGENITINPNLGTGNHYQEFRCIFYVSGTPTMYLGVDVWANGKTPEIKGNRWYELSIAFDSYVGITFGVLTEFSLSE